MRNRIDIAQDIVSCNGNLKTLQEELSQYPWDLPIALLEITASDILKVLRKAIIGEITFIELEDWANLIECRDDFGFWNEELQEIVFQIANPKLNGEMKKESLISVASKLETRHTPA